MAENTKDAGKVQVDASKLIKLLQERNSYLQGELDVISLAYEDRVNEISFLTSRLAEVDGSIPKQVIDHDHA